VQDHALERKNDDFQLRQIAEEVTSEIEKNKRCCHLLKLGGRSEALKVILDKDKMAKGRGCPGY
jgi:hypothetical protein